MSSRYDNLRSEREERNRGTEEEDRFLMWGERREGQGLEMVDSYLRG